MWKFDSKTRQWHNIVDGVAVRIKQTSGTTQPFCCYADRIYLGPAATLEAAKFKCEQRERSSREPILMPVATSVEKSGRTAAKTRIPSLRSR